MSQRPDDDTPSPRELSTRALTDCSMMLESSLIQDVTRRSCPIMDFLDLQILESDGDVLRAMIPVSKNAGNHIGILHAGALFALGEFMGGLVVATHLDDPESFQPVVRDVEIQFKAPATTDVIAESRFTKTQASAMNAQLTESGRFDFTLTTEIRDAHQSLVAETTGSYVIRNFLKR